MSNRPYRTVFRQPTAISFALIFLFSALAASPETRGQGDAFLQPKGKGEIRVYAGGGSTRNYYNVDGNQRLFDSLETSFLAINFGASFDYGLLDRLELNLNLPMGYYAVSSLSRFPDRSIFSPVWYGVGLTCQITRGTLFTSVSSQVKIPPGFHEGIYDDPNHPTFLSDGYWQWTNTINVGYAGDELWVKGSGGYNARGEEPADEIVYSAQIGISRVEGTGIFVGVEGVASTEDASQPLRPFYAGAAGSETEKLRQDGGTGRFRTIDRENYLAVKPGAFVSITDRVTLGADFSLRLLGTNTLALWGFYLGAGYRF